MYSVFGLVGKMIVYVIIIAAFFVLGLFFWTTNEINKLAKAQEERKRSKSRVIEDGGLKIEPGIIKWEDYLDALKTFNDIKSKYSVATQFIPLFPLLGILGTVSGLIQQLGNIEALNEALNTSMMTTFWGLIVAIVLKFLDAVWAGKSIYKKEVEFEIFEQEYNFAKLKQEIQSLEDRT